MQFIFSEVLEAANKGKEPTFVTISRAEVLDVTICSGRTIDTIREWRVCVCSDHRRIRFNLNVGQVEKP